MEIKALRSLILSVLLKKYRRVDANLMTDVILFGELSGKTTHGLIRLFVGESSILAQKPKGKPEIIRKSKLSILIEGNGNPGMLVASLAMKEVIKLAKKSGFGIVGTNGCFSSSGCLSYYLEKTANENLIAIIMAHSPLAICPYGGVEPLFGTNPISFGIPANPRSLIFDMSTAAISYGAILRAKTLGYKLPENVVLDKEGSFTTDPNKALAGAIVAFDRSYKGSGLAMMVEILGGLWTSADFVGKNTIGGWGNLFMVFSPDLLLDVNQFKDRVSKLIETVRNSRTKDGDKVRIPGELTISTRDLNMKRGTVEVEDRLIQELKNLI